MMESRAQSEEIFHGFLVFEKESEFEEIMERDGGSLSRIKVEGGTITETKRHIVIKSTHTPNGESPGRMEVRCSTYTATGNNAIEFYSSNKILVETNKKVTISTPYGPNSDSEFHLKQNSTEENEYLMVNGCQRCVCLLVKDNGNENELVPLKVDEAKREGSYIYRYITVYQDNSSSGLNNIALFFTYKKSDQKTYNCYLHPNDSYDKLELAEIEVGGKSHDELRVFHDKYLKFSTSRGSLESTSDAENTEPDKKVAAGNNDASPTSSFSASVDSGHDPGDKE